MGLVPPNTELYIVDLTSLIADVLQIPDWHRGKRANPVSGVSWKVTPSVALSLGPL